MVISMNDTSFKDVRTRLNFCPCCKSEIGIKYHEKMRRLFTLEEVIIVQGIIYECKNEDCKRFKKPIYPKYETLGKIQVGYDVIALIGILRVHELRTLEQTQEILKDDYGLSLALSTITNYQDTFLQLIGNKPTDRVLEEIRNNQTAVISIDGVQPQAGNDVLYIIREVITGHPLLARILSNSITDNMAKLFEEILQMELPIVGFITDKQSGIVNAIQKVFPEIPHQYCQFHYIKTISDDFTKLDRNLRKKIRKKIRCVTSAFRRLIGSKNQSLPIPCQEVITNLVTFQLEI